MKLIYLQALEDLYNEISHLPTKLLDDEFNLKDTKNYRISFSFEYNSVEAEALIFFDRKPYEIIIATKETNQYFEFILTEKFEVPIRMERDTYDRFVKAFKIAYNPDSKFYPAYFWEFLKTKIPKTLKNTERISSATIVKLNPHIEESHKTKFIRFLDHSSSNRNVTQKNLEKTILLLGEQAYERCKKDNISTCWGY